MKEYIITLRVRERGSLDENILHEFGVGDSEALASAMQAMAAMIRNLGSPEKVAAFMKHQAVVAQMKQLSR